MIDTLNGMIVKTYSLPVIFDLGAVFVFGITGALAAVYRGYDFIGLFALAFVSGVGGGFIRDSIFIQQGPPAVVSVGRYFFAILLWGIVGLLFHKRKKHIGQIIAVFDAAGLGAYAVVGVQKAPAASLSMSASIMVANCREKIKRSSSFTPLPEAWRDLSLVCSMERIINSLVWRASIRCMPTPPPPAGLSARQAS